MSTLFQKKRSQQNFVLLHILYIHNVTYKSLKIALFNYQFRNEITYCNRNKVKDKYSNEEILSGQRSTIFKRINTR